MQYIIDRAQWRCGGSSFNQSARGEGQIRLRNFHGYGDALGLIFEQLGVPESSMIDKSFPHELPWPAALTLPGFLVTRGDNSRMSVLSKKAIEINDDPEMPQGERERALQELFESHGQRISFQGQFAA